MNNQYQIISEVIKLNRVGVIDARRRGAKWLRKIGIKTPNKPYGKVQGLILRSMK